MTDRCEGRDTSGVVDGLSCLDGMIARLLEGPTREGQEYPIAAVMSQSSIINRRSGIELEAPSSALSLANSPEARGRTQPTYQGQRSRPSAPRVA